jgi:hypothetical protein
VERAKQSYKKLLSKFLIENVRWRDLCPKLTKEYKEFTLNRSALESVVKVTHKRAKLQQLTKEELLTRYSLLSTDKQLWKRRDVLKKLQTKCRIYGVNKLNFEISNKDA